MEIKIPAQQAELNGLFSFIGRGKSNDNADKSVTNDIEEIKTANGYNDLMYMEPEAAIRALNTMVEKLSHKKTVYDNKDYKTNNSIKQAEAHAASYADAISEVVSAYRQYAVGMDGELKLIGSSTKTIDGTKVAVPFYKLVLPQAAAATTPANTMSSADIVNLIAAQKTVLPEATQQAAVTSVAPVVESDNTKLIIAGGAGLVVVGALVYALKSSKNKSK